MGINFGVAFSPWSLQPCLVPAHWGLRCFPCLRRELGLPAPSSFISPFFLVSSQLPAPPKFNFPIRESWNSGRPWSLCLGVWPQVP